MKNKNDNLKCDNFKLKQKKQNQELIEVNCNKEDCDKRTTTTDAVTAYKSEVVWTSVLVLGFFHFAGLYGATLRNEATWQTQIFGRVIAILSSYSVTAGAHRLWSHRSYKANSAYQILLMMLMSFIYQNSIYTWTRDHRLHHRYSETNADPHNAKRGFFFSHIGWLMLKKHPDIRSKGKTIDMSDIEANPVVMFQHRHYHKIVFVNCFVIMMFVPWYFFNESLKVCFFYLTCYRLIIILNFTWGINSVAHMYGNKPYDNSIGPVENSLMSYLTFGEGFHNYHHTFPGDYKAGEFGDDGRNSTTQFIDLFAKFGWVWDRKTASAHLIDKQRQHGDGTDNVEQSSTKRIRNVGRVCILCALYGYIL